MKVNHFDGVARLVKVLDNRDVRLVVSKIELDDAASVLETDNRPRLEAVIAFYFYRICARDEDEEEKNF